MILIILKWHSHDTKLTRHYPPKKQKTKTNSYCISNLKMSPTFRMLQRQWFAWTSSPHTPFLAAHISCIRWGEGGGLTGVSGPPGGPNRFGLPHQGKFMAYVRLTLRARMRPHGPQIPNSHTSIPHASSHATSPPSPQSPLDFPQPKNPTWRWVDSDSSNSNKHPKYL